MHDHVLNSLLSCESQHTFSIIIRMSWRVLVSLALLTCPKMYSQVHLKRAYVAGRREW